MSASVIISCCVTITMVQVQVLTLLLCCWQALACLARLASELDKSRNVHSEARPALLIMLFPVVKVSQFRMQACGAAGRSSTSLDELPMNVNISLGAAPKV